MLSAVGTVLAGLSPLVLIAGLLVLADWRDRRRAAGIARQVRLTDAIAAELGGVVAPVVSKPVGGPWRVAMAVPASRPALVSQVVSITHDTLTRLGARRYELVLTPEPAPVRVLETPEHAPRQLRVA
jgi:sugar phosphate isomerase/epimerase